MFAIYIVRIVWQNNSVKWMKRALKRKKQHQQKFSQHALGGWIFGMSVDVDECVYRCYEHFGWWKKTLCLNSNEASLTIRTVNVILLQYNSQQTLLLQCKYFLNLFISTKPMESYSCLRTISYRFLGYSCMMAMIQNSVHSILMEL